MEGKSDYETETERIRGGAGTHPVRETLPGEPPLINAPARALVPTSTVLR